MEWCLWFVGPLHAPSFSFTLNCQKAMPATSKCYLRELKHAKLIWAKLKNNNDKSKKDRCGLFSRSTSYNTSPHWIPVQPSVLHVFYQSKHTCTWMRSKSRQKTLIHDFWIKGRGYCMWDHYLERGTFPSFTQYLYIYGTVDVLEGSDKNIY